MSENKKQIADIISDSGYSKQYLAYRLNISMPTFCQKEVSNSFTVDELIIISDVLDVDIEYLLDLVFK